MSTQPPPPAPPPVGRDRDPVVVDDSRKWGLGDAWIGLLASQLLAAVVGGIVIAAGGYESVDEVPMWLYGLLNLPLHLTLAAVAITASRSKGAGAVRDFRISSRWRDLPNGIVIGVLMQFVVVPLVTLPVLWLFDKDLDDVGESARELADRADTGIGVLTLVLTVGVVAPVVEELFFRGLLLGAYTKRRNLRWLEMFLPPGRRPDTTTRRWNLVVGTIFSSAIFSAIHFQPILFPALFAVGLILAVMTLRTGRLGPAIWAHAAFNATTLVSLLA